MSITHLDDADPNCARCDGIGWVCEEHNDKPWSLLSKRNDACGCGAGEPCPDCNPLANRPTSNLSDR